MRPGSGWRSRPACVARSGSSSGTAANLVGLIYIAAAHKRYDDALRLLDEASAIATASNAPRILEQLTEARAALPA